MYLPFYMQTLKAGFKVFDFFISRQDFPPAKKNELDMNEF